MIEYRGNLEISLAKMPDSCLFVYFLRIWPGVVPVIWRKRRLKEYAAKEDIECWISMEERMACGIGACLACVCKSTEKDAHSNVKNKRVCKEGPVFRAEEVDF